MTWIVGSAAFWGSAILISDICVTFEYADGRKEHHDCLQKIYPLGGNAICGFSGSVLLGFQIIDAFQNAITSISKDTASNINVLANTRWPKVGRHIFREADSIEKRLGCSIIVASAHPTENFGKTPFALINIHIFRSPKFAPVAVERRKIVSIGSGSSALEYVNVLRKMEMDKSLIQLGVNAPQMLAFVVGHRIMRTVEEFPVKGVSKFVQYGVASRGVSVVKDLEYVFGGTAEGMKLPPLLRTEKEFHDYCRGLTKTVAKATC
jgi:hypothetical protein